MKFGAIRHVKFMGSARQWRLEHAPRIEMNVILVRGGGGAQRVCLTGKPGSKGLKIKCENKKRIICACTALIRTHTHTHQYMSYTYILLYNIQIRTYM